MRTVLLTLGAAMNMYLSGTAIASAQAQEGWLCRRYGLYCSDGGAAHLREVVASGGLLVVVAAALSLALLWEIHRRRS